MNNKLFSANLTCLAEELNTIYNGQIDVLQNALIKSSFYITLINGRYDRDVLRPVSDRLGRISTCFITEANQPLTDVELNKLTNTIAKDYGYDLNLLIQDVYFVIRNLGRIKKIPAIRLKYTEIEFYRYHLTNLLRAVETSNKNGKRTYKVYPLIELNWFRFN